MQVHCDQTGERMDVALARLLPDTSRSAAQTLLEDGRVTCAGVIVRKNQKTTAGQALEIDLPEPEQTEILPQNIPLDIRYEDADVLVINKPKGLVVHPAAGHWNDTLVNALLFYCPDTLSTVNGPTRPGIVHRIDKDTSGLLLVAKNNAAHAALAEQLFDHTLARTYEAIVCGKINADVETIDATIGRNRVDRKKMAIDGENARRAVTHCEVLTRFRDYTHIRCRLETGRTHQIRVHLAWKNRPVLGDLVYGHKKPELGQSTQCLHARELSFVHPRTGEPVTVTSELPDYFQNLLAKLPPQSL